MYRNLITTNPNVMMGKPVIAGTRITVEHILEELAAGSTTDELLEAHPRLTREAIQAALARLAGWTPTQKAEAVAKVIRDRGDSLMYAFTVITPNNIRSRPLD